MAVFEYTALTSEGKTVTGVIDADSLKEARQKVKRSGVFPVDVIPGAARPSAAGRRSFLGERVSAAEVSVLTRQLATLLTAGLPLVDSLAALGEQVERTTVKRVVAAVRERIREGATFADALAAHPAVFSSLYVSMVRVGEASGTLDRVLYLGNGQAELGKVDEVVTAPVLSRLYGTEIEVLRAGGHIFVMSRGHDMEHADHLHDHGGHEHHH